MLFENAAKLRRLSAATAGTEAEEVLYGVENLPEIYKVRMFLAACEYIRQFSLPKHFERLLATDHLTSEELEEVEHVLSQIDGAEAALNFALPLVRDAVGDDAVLTEAGVRARCAITSMIERLRTREDIVAVASRMLLTERDPVYLDDGRPGDWFTQFREWDKEVPLEQLFE